MLMFLVLWCQLCAITNLSSHPKRSITLTSSLLRLIILAHSGKLSITKLLHRKSASSLPSSSSPSSLADSFASFFTDKIHKLRLSLAAISSVLSPHSPSPPVTPPQFSSFRPASESEISKLLLNYSNWLLVKFSLARMECLTLTLSLWGWFPASIAINDISLKTRLCGLHFRSRKYWCIFNHFYVIRPESYRIR